MGHLRCDLAMDRGLHRRLQAGPGLVGLAGLAAATQHALRHRAGRNGGLVGGNGTFFHRIFEQKRDQTYSEVKKDVGADDIMVAF